MWAHFQDFVINTLHTTCLPASQASLALFISHLVSPPHNSAPATVASAISAIAFYHKIHAMEDPSASFLIRKILKGLSKTSSLLDSRIPITPPILDKLLAAIPSVHPSRYNQALFSAMFGTMFGAFLCISEVTSSPHNIGYQQVVLTSDSASITFYSYKHHDGQHPFTLVLPATPGSQGCPVRLLSQYIRMRGTRQGPLFCDIGGSPVPPSTLRDTIATAKIFAGLQRQNITSHSFRIGAATYAATKGYSSAQIQAMGRWKSAAFTNYIRISSIQLPSGLTQWTIGPRVGLSCLSIGQTC